VKVPWVSDIEIYRAGHRGFAMLPLSLRLVLITILVVVHSVPVWLCW